MNYPLDKSSRPLFGDAGTATAMEYKEGAPEMQFNIATISSGWNEIITKEGGARAPFNENSLKVEQGADGYLHRPIDCVMNGMNVFAFSLSTPSKTIKQLMEHFALDPRTIDYFLCHQANKYIVDKIRKKAGFEAEKTPICLDEFGNTSNASIPLCVVSRCAEVFATQKQNVLAVAFGTGLMCGVAHIQFNQLKNELIEY